MFIEHRARRYREPLKFCLIVKGKGIYHLIHVEDLTNIMLKAAIEKVALGETFIAAANDPISMFEMVKIIGLALDKRVRIIRLPITPLFIFAYICNTLCSALGIEPPLHRRRVAFYTKDRKFNISKIRQVLNYTPKYDNQTGLTE